MCTYVHTYVLVCTLLTFSIWSDMCRTSSAFAVPMGTCVHTYVRMYLCVLCCTCVYFAGHVTDFE